MVASDDHIGAGPGPKAQVKLFLEASPEVRAERRWREEGEKGREVSFEQVKTELEPEGYRMDRVLEDLPRQHILIFQKTP